MAWQDYMNDHELAEYNSVKEAKEKNDLAFQMVVRKLKNRCDARMRRDPERTVPENRSKADLKESQSGAFQSNDTTNEGADE